VHPANESEFLLELLVQWEELRQQGKSATPEDLCPDDPHLQALLRERLARRQRLQAALDLPTYTRREQPPGAASLPVIEGYAIGELLGRGGMGVVYRARQNVLQRQVALKIVLGGASASAVERARFRTEAEAVARLQHPNIVTVYALGAILYEMLTGRPPFVSTSVLETLDQVREHEPAAPSSLQPRVPHDLEVICLKCLQKAPADRYASAAALAADLQAFLEGEPIQARSLTGLEQIARAIRRNRLDERTRPLSTIYLVAGPVVLLLHLAVYLLWGASPRFPEVIVLVSTVTLVIQPVAIMVFCPWLLRPLSSQHRRRIWAVWGSNLVGSLLALLIFWLKTPADDPERLLLVYPVLGLLTGTAFFAFAEDFGGNYVVGAGIIAVAVLNAFVPFWAPLIVAFLANLNLLSAALVLRRLGAPGDRPA
jgi:hypothetical protein